MVRKGNHKKIIRSGYLNSRYRKNKNNIPVLESGDDLFVFFEESVSDKEYEFVSDNGKTDDGNNAVNLKYTQRFEPGQSRFSGRQTCGNAVRKEIPDDFDLSVKKDEDSEKFSDLLDLSLKGKSMQDLMREKKDKPKPKPVPLKTRLKRYPRPQKILDLHGNTASIAELKTETYIRECRRDGIFTVQIVVGKGLHSQWGPVLPDVVEDLLIKLKKQDVILWFEWDRKKKSQSGAITVYIKQFNK